MGSRIRENVRHLFQCFCEVVQPQPPDKDPWIIQKFPESYNDQEILKMVPKFAYPCDCKNHVIQHFSFVITSIDSKWTFGFCRHDPKTETALVLLSFLPWHESFYKLLDILGEMVISSKAGAEQLWPFLDAVYNNTVPEQGERLQVPYNHGLSNFICQAPNQRLLPSITENRNLMEYYSAVNSANMMIIFASMLYERRIVFTSSRLSRLSACVQAANAIIYPMNWQHIFIPVLPLALIDYLSAPMPFLIGVPSSTLKKVRKSDMGDVVILDADRDAVETPFNDLDSLPSDVVNSLKRQLRNQSALLGDGVSRAFLRALVQLIGGYRDALKFHEGERITFNEDAFVESRPTSMQPFLRKMLQLQIFQQFIEERLEMLNAGFGFSDEFESEACIYSDKASGKLKQQYKEWMTTMRKEGTAFFKSVKSKANPAVKSAVKSVKDRGKDVRSAYKGIRSKFRELQPPSREYAGSTEQVPNVSYHSNSAPNSPPQRRRPATFTPFNKLSPTAAMTFRKDPSFSTRKASMQETRNHNYSPLSPGEASCGSPSPPGCSTPGLQLSPIDTDLMGDLQDMIFPKCSSLVTHEEGMSSISLPPVDRTLKPVRSFDSLGGRNFLGIANNPSSISLHTPPLSLSPAVPPPRSRSGPPLSPPLTSFETLSPIPGGNPSFPQKIFLQQSPLAFSTPKTDVCAFTPSPDDVFMASSSMSGGHTPFVPIPCKSTFFVSPSPALSQAPTLPLTAPSARQLQGSKHPQSPSDLIRLDSTPSYEDFDPLTSKDSPSISVISSSPAVSNINSNSNVLQRLSGINKDSGLTNPLYPYYVPQGNQSMLFSQAAVGAAPQTRTSYPVACPVGSVPFIQPVNAVNINQPSNFDCQDSELLREYGLDFKSPISQNGGPAQNGSILKPVVTDPFEEVERLVGAQQQCQNKPTTQSSWTTFE